MTSKGILALETGEVFEGVSIGIEGLEAGELIFNTGMTGYQEILTDPSYCKQIINFTCPHIGNVGTNEEDFESRDGNYKNNLVSEFLRQIRFVENETNGCKGIYSGATDKPLVPNLYPGMFSDKEGSYHWMFDHASDSASRPVGVTGARGSSL